MSKYLTAPQDTEKMPSGIPYIIGNETAERFSFYGMKGILFVFMTQYLMDATGELATMSDIDARKWTHLFNGAVYATPFAGAILADIFLGKYKTIMLLSIVYCLGHFTLALDETRLGLTVGLSLIAIGAGGIKPCVSAHVGDQFGRRNHILIEKVFGWFYISINIGAFASMLLTPWLLAHEDYGAQWAFGVPGVLMAIATVFFWLGRHRFAHIPAGGKERAREIFSVENLKVAKNLCIIYLFVAFFWSLFDQTTTAWVQQARDMDRTLFTYMGVNPETGVEESMPFLISDAQVQAANPGLILILVPLFSYFLYPYINRFTNFKPLYRIATGLFMMVPAWLVTVWIQTELDAGNSPSIYWQLLAYVILTASEVLVSVTGLELSYKQAPKDMKSFVMSIWLLSVAVGNWFTAFVNWVIEREDGTVMLEGVAYYWFFTGLMFVVAILFLAVPRFYKEKEYIHGVDDDAIDHSEALEEGLGK